MNPYQHAIHTRRIALNDNGLLAWVKHNEQAILQSLTICRHLAIAHRCGIMPVAPIHEIEVDPVPVGFETWHDAEVRN